MEMLNFFNHQVLIVKFNIYLIVFFIIFFLGLAIILNRKKIFLKIDSKRIFPIICILYCAFAFVFFVGYDNYDTHLFSKVKAKEATILSTINNDFKLALNNNIIVVGDSRMSLIRESDKSFIPINVSFIAKSSMSYNWFVSVAMPELEKQLLNRNKTKNYSVIINMGVNDIFVISDVRNRVQDYFKKYKYLAEKYEDVNFYFLSINPVDDETIVDSKGNHGVNKRIELFNQYMFHFIDENKQVNLAYCDAYHKVKFETYDGLHYTDETNERILNYLGNKCVVYQ